MSLEIKITKEDLINMVKGVRPSYDLFENEVVKRCGTYNGSYGSWSWNTYELEKLKVTDLYALYILCRDCYKQKG